MEKLIIDCVLMVKPHEFSAIYNILPSENQGLIKAFAQATRWKIYHVYCEKILKTETKSSKDDFDEYMKLAHVTNENLMDAMFEYTPVDYDSYTDDDDCSRKMLIHDISDGIREKRKGTSIETMLSNLLCKYSIEEVVEYCKNIGISK